MKNKSLAFGIPLDSLEPKLRSESFHRPPPPGKIKSKPKFDISIKATCIVPLEKRD